MNVLSELISCYDSIGLHDMGQLQLMNRVDTKFLLPYESLIDCLSANIEDYAVVEVNGKEILPYFTTYYDTADLAMYHEHHNGKNKRYKVRYREYLESGDKFFEVKMKEKDRTCKKRISVDHFEENLLGERQTFVSANSPYAPNELSPVLSTRFDRITLVSKESCERITIDLNISFEDDNNQKTMGNCVIVEVKRNREEVFSKLARSIKSEGFQPTSISKYCIGAIALNRNIKYNRFKPRVREVNKLIVDDAKLMLQVG